MGKEDIKLSLFVDDVIIYVGKKNDKKNPPGTNK